MLDDDAHGRIDGRVNQLAPGAQQHGGRPHHLGVDAGHIAGARRLHGVDFGGRGQPVVGLDDLRVAALGLDDLAELVQRRAVGQQRLGLLARPLDAPLRIGQRDHAGGQLQGQLGQVGGPFAL